MAQSVGRNLARATGEVERISGFIGIGESARRKYNLALPAIGLSYIGDHFCRISIKRFIAAPCRSVLGM
jgi:hypothetical protein